MKNSYGGDSTKTKKITVVEVKPLVKKVTPEDTEFKKARVAKENAKHAKEFKESQLQSYESGLAKRMSDKMKSK